MPGVVMETPLPPLNVYGKKIFHGPKFSFEAMRDKTMKQE